MFNKSRKLRMNAVHFFNVVLLTILTLISYPAYAADGHAHALRLGSAALPYGWATAIADFDSDQKPDFAIANKIGTSSRGYEYSIELELSLESRQVFRFHSADSALSIAALDLDNDQDLDLVLTRTVNGEIVGVWINNGHGRFSEGGKPDAQSVLQSLSSRAYRETAVAFVSLGTTPRKVMPLRAKSIGLSATNENNRQSLNPVDHRSKEVNRNLSITPRAPPAQASL
jgi:hypothetical protein